MNMIQYLNDLRSNIEGLHLLDLGYPLGTNAVLPPRPAEAVDEALGLANLSNLPALREFYVRCDGISLPDVHVGYFLEPIARLAGTAAQGKPGRIVGAYSGDIVVIGSTGGGGLFALGRPRPCVYLLPPSLVKDGAYHAEEGRAKVVADSFESFLDHLLADVRAYVQDTPGHAYLDRAASRS